MKINLNWAPSLATCHECGHEQQFSACATCRVCDYHAGSDLSAEWTAFVETLDDELPVGISIDFAHETEGEGDGYWLDMDIQLRRGYDNDEGILREWIAKTGTVEEPEIRAALLGCGNPIDEEMSEIAIERLLDALRAEEWSAELDDEVEAAETALSAVQSGKTVFRGEDESGNFWWY